MAFVFLGSPLCRSLPLDDPSRRRPCRKLAIEVLLADGGSLTGDLHTVDTCQCRAYIRPLQQKLMAPLSTGRIYLSRQTEENSQKGNDVEKVNLDTVISALEKPDYKWRTVRGVAKDSQLAESEVLEVLTEHPDLIVQSTVLSKTGESLFSTRRHIRKRASLGEKLIGAFKYRIR